jgi:hypothetical protein
VLNFVTTNAQCHIRRVTSPGGREIYSESGGYVSVPKYDQSGVEIGRESFLKSQFTTDETGRLRLEANQKPAKIFGDYKWNKGQLTRTVTDAKTGRVVTETLDNESLHGLCR